MKLFRYAFIKEYLRHTMLLKGNICLEEVFYGAVSPHKRTL
jgi:hypothetical protein